MSESYLQPKTHFSTHFIAWRFYLVIILITLAVCFLSWRLFSLTILNQQFLRHQGDERILRQVRAPAFRGMIFDRNGHPLAISTKVYSAWINPKGFNPSRLEVNKLSNLLHLSARDILSLAKTNRQKDREFAYLKRGLSPQLAQQINLLNLSGLYMQEEYRRYYPEGEITAQVTGITNIDDQGQEGIELGYDAWLRGNPGKKMVIKDRLGRIIADFHQIQGLKAGQDLTLSIDKRIQYLAYRELLLGVKKNQAASGSIVVLDVKTGEILAMVNQPSFNPNKRPISTMTGLRNRAVTDSFEPGSTIKAFTIAAALESKLYQPASIIDTSPGWMRVGRNMVKDHRNLGRLSLTQILQVSSNMGVAKIVLSLPPDQLWSLLHRVGFGEITALGFPGEQSGLLIKPDHWGAFPLATLSFGYGLSVTPLQLARAYAIIANDGIKLPISLLKLTEPPQGEPVMSAQVASEVRALLESVVAKGGTGTAASVPGYRVAGKTGTAKMVGVDGYEKHSYNSNFVGMAPSDKPRIVVAVILRDLQGKKYYGGEVSAPIFAKVMEGALRLMNIPPSFH